MTGQTVANNAPVPRNPKHALPPENPTSKPSNQQASCPSSGPASGQHPRYPTRCSACLGRLANYNEELAEAVRFYKKAASFVLRAVSKHSPELAQSVVDSGALNALVTCLEEFDPGVKESAAWALGYIARHNGDLAQAVVDAGAIPLLLAQSVVDANTIPFIAPLLGNPDAKLRRQVCSALSQISKHTVDLAETVVDGEIFPNVLNCLKDSDGYVKKNIGSIDCQFGGIAAVVDYVTDARGNARLPGIMTLGYIAAFSETLALAVILAKGVPPLAQALVTETEEHIKAACAWSLGQIGRHSPDHAKILADNAVLPKLLKVLTSTYNPTAAPNALEDDKDVGSDLKTKTKRALKCILEKTLYLDALEPLLQPSTPFNVLKYVVGQFAKILPNDVAARRAFVTSGGLQRVQEIAAGLGSATGPNAGQINILNGTKMGEFIRTINECYPEEIVRYYSPGYSATLLEKIDEYSRKHDQASTEQPPKVSVVAENNPVTPSVSV
ncbi:ARM repeat-containing protein [Rhizoclosmatium globosum]|uniref:ARM repeat-containing protein n=1 Tax=Rhizoclosmatium globosum TaxID=329046 RepID=A0A1Y2AKV3_9FUNG|nr:ARM repeat-containing protein [Rhizoclosmatium globosum]|eukprot:ORY23189.1 ARM repeat-containing protein [Rhizoclosmatium globosum]